jgi:hypothetical protein
MRCVHCREPINLPFKLCKLLLPLLRPPSSIDLDAYMRCRATEENEDECPFFEDKNAKEKDPLVVP